MSQLSANPVRGLVAFAVFIFLAVSIFGLWHAFAMEISKTGEMRGCIFTGKAMLCTMSAVEHVALWQRLFAPIAPKNSALLILASMIFFSLWQVFRKYFFPEHADALAQKLYNNRHSDLPFYDPLQQAFSSGILHSRLYN